MIQDHVSRDICIYIYTIYLEKKSAKWKDTCTPTAHGSTVHSSQDMEAIDEWMRMWCVNIYIHTDTHTMEYCTHTCVLNDGQLFAIPRMVVHRAPLSMGLSWQEHWRGLPFPTPGDLPNPGIEPMCLLQLLGRRILYHWESNGILLSHKKEWNNAICSNMDETYRLYYVK